MEIVTFIDEWIVQLRGGASLSLWASGYSEDGGEYLFTALVDVDEDGEEFSGLTVAGRTPSDPRRFDIVLARIPVSEVESIASAGALP